jgi:hypothetical protein
MVRPLLLASFACVGLGSWGLAEECTTPEPNRSAASKPDRSYGTALEWETSVEAAAKKADRFNRLLLVLAVAGHFEDPFFT